MSSILVAAPHPDDETLGCGGTLLRHRSQGDQLHWLIFTEMLEKYGYSADAIATRNREIIQVADRFAFASVHRLGLPTTQLDTLPKGDIIGRVLRVFKEVEPEVVYVPYRGDAHSDHAAVFDAVAACCKWFRFPSVRRVLMYETPSETDSALHWDGNSFTPNVFMDVSAHVDEKIAILNIYDSELGKFPFPRSVENIRALAATRGAASGFQSAEAFMLLKERR